MYDLQKIPIGLYEKALPPDLSIREKLFAAKDLGYDFFEISIDESDERLSRLDWDLKKRAELVNDMRESGIPVLSMCLSGHRRYPMGSPNTEIRKKAMEIMKKAICFSADTGIRIIQLAGYDVYYEEGSEETRRLFIDGLKKSVGWAEKAGAMLTIEVMDSEFINSVQKAMEYVREINSPWLKVYPDIGNMSAWGNDLEEDLEAGRGHIAAVHVKETLPGIYRDLQFGNGNVDFVKAFSKLSSMGYNGPFLIEMWADSCKEPINEVKNSLNWIKGKMKESGMKIC